MRAVLVSCLVLLVGLQRCYGQDQLNHDCKDYKIGEPIHFECRAIDEQGNTVWEPGPICMQVTVEEAELISIYRRRSIYRFRLESMRSYTADGLSITHTSLLDYKIYCSGMVYRPYSVSSDAYSAEDWICRVRMAPEHDVYIPVVIPLWGVVEAEHIHINNHLNFVFHAEGGKIIGVGVYPRKYLV